MCFVFPHHSPGARDEGEEAAEEEEEEEEEREEEATGEGERRLRYIARLLYYN